MRRALKIGLTLILLVMVGLTATALHLAQDRERLSGALSNAAGQLVTIERLELTPSPPAVSLWGVRIGETAWGSCDALAIQLDPMASLRSLYPVVRVSVAGIRIDLADAAANASAENREGAVLPMLLPFPIRIAELDLTDAALRFHLGDDPSVVSLDHLTGAALLTPFLSLREMRFAVMAASLGSLHEAIEIDHAEGSGEIGSHGLLLDDATVAGPRIHLNGHRDVAHPLRLLVQGDFDISLLGVFVEALRWVTGEASVEGFLEGDVANPYASIGLDLRDGAIAGRPVGHLTTRMVRDGFDMQFEDARIVGAPGSLSAVVGLDFRGEAVQLDGRLAQVDVEVAKVLDALGVSLPLDSVVYRGEATVRGPLDPLELTVTAEGKALVETKGVESAVRVDALAHADDARIDYALRPSDSSLLLGAVAIGSSLDAELKLESDDIGPFAALAPQPFPQLSLSGSVRASATISGPPAAPQVAVQVQASSFALGSLQIGSFNGGGTIEGGNLALRELTLRSGEGTVRARGMVGLSPERINDWHAQIAGADADFLYDVVDRITGVRLPLAEGRADGELGVKGSWDEPALQGSLRVDEPRLWRQPLRDVNATVAMVDGSLFISADGRRHRGEELRVDFRQPPHSPADLTVHAREILIGDEEQESSIRARLDGDAEIHGDWEHGWVQADLSQIQTRGLIVPDVSARMDIHGGRAQIELVSEGRKLAASGSLAIQPPYPLEMDASWNGVLAEVPSAGGRDLRVDASARAHLRADAEDPLRISGDIDVARLSVSRGDYGWNLRSPVRLSAVGGTFRWDDAEWNSTDSVVHAAGAISTSGEARLGVRGSSNLGILQLGIEPLISAGGRGDFDMRLERQSGNPWQIDGTVGIRQGALDFGGPLAPEGMQGTLRFHGTEVVVDDFSGKLGGGRFSVRGLADLERGSELSWTAERVGADLVDDLEILFSGRGELRGPWLAPTFAGTIDVSRAVYDRDVDLTDLFLIVRNKLIGGGAITTVPKGRRSEGGGGPVLLDLELRAPGGVYLDNNVAKVEGALRMRLQGTVSQPVLTGTIRILDGDVVVSGHKFSLSGGSIEQRDALAFNPLLNISAESRISTPQADYIVSANVSGTAADPRIAFSSDDSSLTQNDILALVTFGRTASELQRGGGGVSAIDALALVPTGPVEKQLEHYVGLDEFEIRAIEEEDTGRVEPQIRIGKRINNRIRASVATSIGVRSWRSVELEYDLTRRISLLSTWKEETRSEAGAFGGAVKFRYEFRRSPFSLLRQAIGDDVFDDAAP